MGEVNFSAPRFITEQDSVDGFSCGIDPIDVWVFKHALSARRLGTAVVYATYDQDGKLAGFYTLSSQSIFRGDAKGWISRNAPDQIPVILLGMMGIDKKYQGLGLGRQLMIDLAHRCHHVADEIGARAIVVDPIDENVRAFYSHFGFREIPGSSRMFAKIV